MEARAAFDRMLTADAVPAVIPRENEESDVVRQNREALKSWNLPGVTLE